MKVNKCNSGVENRTKTSREINDFYATHPQAIEELLKVEKFSPNVWECACGQGHLSEVLKNHGYQVKSTDLIDRGYGEGNVDFLKTNTQFDGDIITNPPYFCAKQFIEHALELVPEGRRVVMFLKLSYLEGKKRKKFYEKYPPEYVYVSSSRVQCAKGGDFEKYAKTGTATAYGWYVWRKGSDPTNEPRLRWFN